MLRSYEKRHALGSLQGVLSSPVNCSSITESLPIVICLRSKVWFVFPAAASVSSDQPNHAVFFRDVSSFGALHATWKNMAKLYIMRVMICFDALLCESDFTYWGASDSMQFTVQITSTFVFYVYIRRIESIQHKLHRNEKFRPPYTFACIFQTSHRPQVSNP